MKRKLNYVTYAMGIGLVGLFAVASVRGAAEPNAKATAIFHKMMTAVMVNDYDDFVAEGTDTFKAAMTKPALESVNRQLAPRLKGGFESTYLGALNQKGSEIHLWKLTYTDGEDDTLVKLVLRRDKVEGFWLQ